MSIDDLSYPSFYFIVLSYLISYFNLLIDGDNKISKFDTFLSNGHFVHSFLTPSSLKDKKLYQYSGNRQLDDFMLFMSSNYKNVESKDLVLPPQEASDDESDGMKTKASAWTAGFFGMMLMVVMVGGSLLIIYKRREKVNFHVTE